MPATDGDYSVHTGHEPVAVAVDPGTVRFCVEGQWREVIVGQGFAEGDARLCNPHGLLC